MDHPCTVSQARPGWAVPIAGVLANLLERKLFAWRKQWTGDLLKECLKEHRKAASFNGSVNVSCSFDAKTNVTYPYIYIYIPKLSSFVWVGFQHSPKGRVLALGLPQQQLLVFLFTIICGGVLQHFPFNQWETRATSATTYAAYLTTWWIMHGWSDWNCWKKNTSLWQTQVYETNKNHGGSTKPMMRE